MMLFSYLRPVKNSKLGKPRVDSQNKLRIQCDNCKLEFDTTYAQRGCRLYPDLCKSCATSASCKDREHPLLSEEHKAKIKASFTAEKRKYLSDLVSGEKNRNYGTGLWQGRNEKHNQHLKAWKGKTNAEIHGIEKAAIIGAKLSAKCKGELNPMYGKPAPIGSGSGWSGWYQGKYFRSLLELSFMIAHPEATSAEIISIKYVKNGVARTYRPDFLIDDIIIELKPKAMVSLPENLLKFAAARILYGDRFKVLTEDDINKIDVTELSNLVDNGQVKLNQKYLDKLNANRTPDKVLC